MCDGEVAGIFTANKDSESELNVFTEVSSFNDWIDDHFKLEIEKDMSPEEVTRSSFWPWSTKAPPVLSDDPRIRK